MRLPDRWIRWLTRLQGIRVAHQQAPHEPQSTPGQTGLLAAAAQQPASEPVAVSAASSAAVPYDETLLERARTQWQFGDWQSLAGISRDTLQHHPDRAKLSLLAAAGHQQLGDQSAARQFIRLAQDWGCSRAMVARVLLAGAHNTLGMMAAAAGEMPRALKHFQSSIATGTPNTDFALAARARAVHQWQALGLPGGVPALEGDALDVTRPAWKLVHPFHALAVAAPSATAAAAEIQTLSAELQQQQAQLAQQAKDQKDHLIKVRKHLESVLKNEMLNATRQLEAFIGVQSALAGGDLLPQMHGWPISPDLAALLIELIRSNDYDLVIEFGSGTSTLVMARALAQMRQRRQGKAPVVQVAFEHLESYHAQTVAQLRTAGLADAVTVHHAPLEPYYAANGKTYSYYRCQAELEALKTIFDTPGCRVLVLVDGPPEATGEHARYPAGPLLLDAFAAASSDWVLDDFRRPGEKAVASLWEAELRSLGRAFAVETKPLEKEACIFRITAQQSVSDCFGHGQD